MTVAFRITWRRVLAAVAAVALLGLAFIYSGIFNVAASSGHWPITTWVLHTTMESSVRTYAAVSAPKEPVDDAGLVSAANHFAQACAICHGAPGRLPSPVMQAATPHAPDLSINAAKWPDDQLFWILQHGVKYSGMPAWPALERVDEIKRMTGFVRRLPGMSPAEYARLTRPALPAGNEPLAASCASCHGSDGRGRGAPDIPVLGGQNAGYLAASLRAYRGGGRHSGVMQTAAAPLGEGDIDRLAQHYAAMPGLTHTVAAGNGPADAVIRRGLPRQQLPACTSCHASGKPYPAIAGQKAAYIAARLRAWRGDKNVPDAKKAHGTMPVIARRIPEELIDPVARQLAGE